MIKKSLFDNIFDPAEFFQTSINIAYMTELGHYLKSVNSTIQLFFMILKFPKINVRILTLNDPASVSNYKKIIPKN